MFAKSPAPTIGEIGTDSPEITNKNAPEKPPVGDRGGVLTLEERVEAKKADKEKMDQLKKELDREPLAREDTLDKAAKEWKGTEVIEIGEDMDEPMTPEEMQKAWAEIEAYRKKIREGSIFIQGETFINSDNWIHRWDSMKEYFSRFGNSLKSSLGNFGKSAKGVLGKMLGFLGKIFEGLKLKK